VKRKEVKEVLLLFLLSICALTTWVMLLNRTGGAAPGMPASRRVLLAGASMLSMGLFLAYAYKVYFRPEFGRRAWRALVGMLLLHLALNLIFLSRGWVR
jgi:hypothetical protein